MCDLFAMQCEDSSKCVLKLVYGADNCFYQSAHGRQHAPQAQPMLQTLHHCQT